MIPTLTGDSPELAKDWPGGIIGGHSNSQLPFHYGVYGISLHSEFELSLPEQTDFGLTEIEICAGAPALFKEAICDADLQSRSDWYNYAYLSDGSSYVRWSGLGEFLVSSDGRRITCARAAEAPMESFQVYLLGQALSFALVKNGFEPLHGTAVAVDGEAIVFLGGSGFGKSTLAASFLAAGASLITDDLLILQARGSGFDAFPGPSRIKLFPKLAERFLGRTSAGVPMNAGTGKLVIPVDQRLTCSAPLPLRAIYALASPAETDGTQQVRIEPLSSREAFLALVSNTFNYMIVDPERLARQVRETTRLLSAFPVKRLYHPRVLDDLSSVREAIFSDLNHSPLTRDRGSM